MTYVIVTQALVRVYAWKWMKYKYKRWACASETVRPQAAALLWTGHLPVSHTRTTYLLSPATKDNFLKAFFLKIPKMISDSREGDDLFVLQFHSNSEEWISINFCFPIAFVTSWMRPFSSLNYGDSLNLELFSCILLVAAVRLFVVSHIS